MWESRKAKILYTMVQWALTTITANHRVLTFGEGKLYYCRKHQRHIYYELHSTYVADA